jgi:UDP-N-acetylglucosamine 2-epimerase (non-hydrolysing)
VIPELDKYTDHILVHTGQNYDYELNEIFFDGMNVRRPEFFLNAAGDNAAKTIGNVIIGSDEAIKRHRPDAVLLYGDTNSCLSVISAKRNRVPVFHMEAGNRCFDERVPEEINRRIVDHLSDINMTITEHARRYLIAEGISPETIIKVGSSMKEVLERQKETISASDVLERMRILPGDYFVLSAHREENIDSEENIGNLIKSINIIAEKYKKQIIISTHPRTRKKLDSMACTFNDYISFLKPLSFADYIKLQMNSRCVISDSGTITEEASLLNFPAVTIRQAHERPEGMDEGTLIMTGLKSKNIINAIEVVTDQNTNNASHARIVPDYEASNVSRKVVRIILSYRDYIMRTVWRDNG